MNDRPELSVELVDIVSRPVRRQKQRNGAGLTFEVCEGPMRFRVNVRGHKREENVLLPVEGYVIDCRNRAAVEHVMSEIRRLMERLDGKILNGDRE